MTELIDNANFVLCAAKHYDNPQCVDTVEFYDDLKRFKYLRRLFNRYIITGDLKHRLILNHIIILYNVFGSEIATKLLFVKLEPFYPQLKPFLVMINQMPSQVTNIIKPGLTIYDSDITMDTNVITQLRML
jgi:hypothetical protein